LKKDLESDMKYAELHAKFSRESATNDEAAKGWLELVDRYYCDPAIIADLQIAASSLESSFSEDNWRRLKALKQEAISRLSK
jgi:hypothetical protein